MTKTRRKLHARMKRAFREAVQARKRHQRAIASYKKLVRRYRAA
jgi:hypothetical protein